MKLCRHNNRPKPGAIADPRSDEEERQYDRLIRERAAEIRCANILANHTPRGPMVGYCRRKIGLTTRRRSGGMRLED
jgi:hypothetical protein